MPRVRWPPRLLCQRSRAGHGAANTAAPPLSGAVPGRTCFPFIAFPGEVRRILHTTNAIEAVNAKLRRAVRARGQFPTDDAALKLPFLVLNRAEKSWTMLPDQWCLACAQFTIIFGERCTIARDLCGPGHG